MNKIKIKRKRLTVKGAANQLHKISRDSQFLVSLAYPPYDPGEIDEAKFLAVTCQEQLSKPNDGESSDKANRRRALAVIFMYQMLVGGTENWLRNPGPSDAELGIPEDVPQCSKP